MYFQNHNLVLPVVLLILSTCSSDIIDTVRPTFYCDSTISCKKSGYQGHVECQDIGRGKQCVCAKQSRFEEDGCFKQVRDSKESCDYDRDCKSHHHICKSGTCQCSEGRILIHNKCVNKPLIGHPCQNDTECNTDRGIHCNKLLSECHCESQHFLHHGRCVFYKNFIANICRDDGDCGAGNYCRKQTESYGACVRQTRYLGEACDTNEQCTNGKIGTYCNDGKCECERKSAKKGECIIEGECLINGDCAIPNSYCYGSTCHCRKGTVLVDNTECVKIHHSIGSICRSDDDCKVGKCFKEVPEKWGICSCAPTEVFVNGVCKDEQCDSKDLGNHEDLKAEHLKDLKVDEDGSKNKPKRESLIENKSFTKGTEPQNAPSSATKVPIATHIYLVSIGYFYFSLSLVQ